MRNVIVKFIQYVPTQLTLVYVDQYMWVKNFF